VLFNTFSFSGKECLMNFRLIGQDDFGHGKTLEVTANTEDEARALALREGIAVISVKRLADDPPPGVEPAVQQEGHQKLLMEARYDLGEAQSTRRFAFGLFAVVVIGLPGVVIFFAHAVPMLITAIIVSLIFVPIAILAYRSAQRRIACRGVILRLDETGLRYSPYGRNALHIPWQEIIAAKEVVAKGSAALVVTYRNEIEHEVTLRVPISQLDRRSWTQVWPTVKRAVKTSQPIYLKESAVPSSNQKVGSERRTRILTQGWFISLAIGLFSLCACLTLVALELALTGERFGFQNSWRLTASAILSQPAWIGLAIGAWLFARKVGWEGSGSLGVGGRVFAGLFAIIAIAAGGYLLWEGYTNPGIGDPNTIGKMQKFGWSAVVAGVLGIVYCVFGGRDPEAPELPPD
jgi:hypothetical protein